MYERRHSVLIGAFVVGGLLIAIAAILFFAGAGFGTGRERVIMAFDSSVKGLQVGAPVALRGVQIGQVTDISLVLSSDEGDITMLVAAEISGDNVQVVGRPLDTDSMLDYLIGNDLRAQLVMESVLTGLLYVQMDFHPDSPAELAQTDSPYRQIPTLPTELELLRRTLQSVDYAELAEAVEVIAGSLRAFVENDDFRALPGELRGSLAALEDAGTRIGGSLQRLEPELERLLVTAGDAAADIHAALPALRGELSAALRRLDATLANAERAAATVDRRLGADSSTVLQLQATLRDVTRASRALQGFLRLLEEQPDALLRGRREPSP